MRRLRQSASIFWAAALRAIPALVLAALVLLFHGLAEAGLRVGVIEAAEVRASGHLDETGRILNFTSADGTTVRMSIAPHEEDVINPAFDGRLHPFEGVKIEAAVREMIDLPGPDLPVRIYSLPGLPLDAGKSFCVGSEIFLSPGLAPVSEEIVASTVVHELGHALHHRRLPDDNRPGWEFYLRLRSLDPERHHSAALHRNRPQEIFAEDFRRLFGGARANYSGTHENPELTDPSRVSGLREFFLGVISGAYRHAVPVARVGNRPNPFNPRTTIELRLRPEQAALGGNVRIDVFDLRGRHVRALGQWPVAESIRVPWEGEDDRGRAVASGRYSYRVQLGSESVVGSMMLLQ